MTQQLTSPPRRKLLDEASFQQLLAAAYVLQEHNESLKARSSNPGEILTEIVRIQRLIRGGGLGVADNAKLIAEQTQSFINADGVTIGIVTATEIIYLAASGTASREIGLRLARDSSLSSYCVLSRVTLRSNRTEDDPRMPFEACYKSGVKSFIAIPVNYENKVVAVLEARFKNPIAFREEDVRACELMAGLVNEIIVQAAQLHPAEQPEANEPATLESNPPERSGDISSVEDPLPLDERLEEKSDYRLDAQTVAPLPLSSASANPVPVERVSSELASPDAETVSLTKKLEEPVPSPEIAPGEHELASPDTVLCRGCGQDLSAEELFCGKCGTERQIKPDGPLQSKWASLWFMNQARKNTETDQPALLDASTTEDDSEAAELQKPAPALETNILEHINEEDIPLGDELIEAIRAAEKDTSVSHALIPSAVSSSAASVQLHWLPEIAASESWLRHQWRVNRANFYLAGAAMVLIVVLFGWGTAPVESPNTAANSGPQLSLLEKILVGLGIAEAPATPVYLGNPDTPVWVDLHTALYYCPGADLYGKTDGGKIATQRSAQMDQFEPAHRKPCN